MSRHGKSYEVGRPASKFVQNVKHLKDVPKSKLQETYYATLKEDGVCGQLIVDDGIAALYSRTNKRQTNLEDIERHYSGTLPDGCYRCEICDDTVSLEQLSGDIGTLRVKALERTPHFRLSFFDYIPLDDFVEGYCNLPYHQRHLLLGDRTRGLLRKDDRVLPVRRVSRDAFEQLAAAVTRKGYEGIVGYADVDWQAGHKGWRVVKIVNSVSYDLECIGWEEGEGKYTGLVANLKFRWKGGRVITAMLGKGWSHKDAQDLFIAIHRGDYTPVDKIYKVNALFESSKGVLRLPKVGERRDDKEQPDY